MSGRRPLIGVTTSVSIGSTPERAYVNSVYLEAVQQAGGVPVLLPPSLEAAALDALAALIDGLLLTGGGDVDPARYDEDPHPALYDVVPARDALEIAAVRTMLLRRRPILAICRGLQVLNVALGGSLYQDLGSDPGTSLAHGQREPRDEPTHKVRVAPMSRLARVLGTEELEVNSMHHQGVKRPGAHLVPVAWAPDELVEALEHEDRERFVLAVQWHPEELVDRSEFARRLFRALVDAARRD